jgi:hypothetical protein
LKRQTEDELAAVATVADLEKDTDARNDGTNHFWHGTPRSNRKALIGSIFEAEGKERLGARSWVILSVWMK